MTARNGCDADLSVVPLDCASTCSDPVVIPRNSEAPLPLPKSPKNGERRRLSYSVGSETGTVVFEYVQNDCDGKEGCSLSTFRDDRVPRGSAPAIALGILLLRRRALRASRVLEKERHAAQVQD